MERRGKDREGGRQFCFQQTVCTEYRVRVSEAEEATYALNRARRRIVSAPDQLTDDKFLRKKERCL